MKTLLFVYSLYITLSLCYPFIDTKDDNCFCVSDDTFDWKPDVSINFL